MPPVRSARNRKPPPDGFDDIEDTLLEFSNKMKDAENASHEGKKRHEVMWPIFQISHQRMYTTSAGGSATEQPTIGSRYIYELYYEKEAISKQLYDWLLKNGYADGSLIAKWKKQGYEKVPTLEIQCLLPFTDCVLSVAVLSTMCSNQRDEFQRNVHMPSTKSPAKGGSND